MFDPAQDPISSVLARSRLTRRGFLTASTGAASAALLLAACGSTTSASTQTDPQIATHINLGFQTPYIAVFVLEQQKLLQKAFPGSTTAFNFHVLSTLSPITQALGGGSLDLGIGGTPIGAVAAGLPLTVVALVEHSPKTHAIIVPANSSIKSIADLKGKKIGGPQPLTEDTFVVLALQKAGLQPGDVKWYTVDNNSGRSALKTGAIDAWRTWDPFYANAQVTDGAAPLVDGVGYIQNYVTLFARNNYLSKYPETIKRFIQSYKQALAYVKAHQSASVNLFVQENKLSSQVAELTFNRRNYLISTPTPDFLADAEQQSQILKQFGYLKVVPDWSKAVNTTLAQQALGS